jgi:hypothetical protein
LVLVAAVVAAFLVSAAPAAAVGFMTWHATVSGPVLHGAATVTERPAARVRFAVTVKGAASTTRPVMELVNAACGSKGSVLGVAHMLPATKAGVSRGFEIFSLSQAARFNAWVKAGKTISVHVVGPQLRVLPITHSCGNLAKVG